VVSFPFALFFDVEVVEASFLFSKSGPYSLWDRLAGCVCSVSSCSRSLVYEGSFVVGGCSVRSDLVVIVSRVDSVSVDFGCLMSGSGSLSSRVSVVPSGNSHCSRSLGSFVPK
jgi:hypothetical protein